MGRPPPPRHFYLTDFCSILTLWLCDLWYFSWSVSRSYPVIFLSFDMWSIFLDLKYLTLGLRTLFILLLSSLYSYPFTSPFFFVLYHLFFILPLFTRLSVTFLPRVFCFYFIDSLSFVIMRVIRFLVKIVIHYASAQFHHRQRNNHLQCCCCCCFYCPVHCHPHHHC